MAAHQTTMNDLLANLKRICLAATASGQSLFGIAQIKRGVLPPQYQHPLLTIIPEYERVESQKSSGICIMVRGVRFYLFGVINRQQDVYNLQNYMDKVHELVRTNRDVKDSLSTPTVIDYDSGPIALDAETGGVTFDAMFTSEHVLPARTIANSTSDNPTPESIRNAVFTRLSTLQATALSAIRLIVKESWDLSRGVIVPSVVVRTTDQNSTEEISGYDRLRISLAIDLYTKVAGASDETLVSHLTIFEALRNSLIATPCWGGIADDTVLGNVNFASELAENELLYNSEINLEVIARHV